MPINDNPKLEFEKIMELFVDKHYQKLDSDKKRKDARRQIEKDNLKMPHGKKLIKNELPQ